MRFGLGARLAVIFAALVAVTALLTSVASVVTTSGQVNDDIDRFLRDRADEIVDGRRDGPRDRRGSGGEISDDELADAIEDATGSSAVDADAEVQALDEDGRVVATTGVTLPVSSADTDLAGRKGSPVYRTVTIDGTEYRMITMHVEGGGAIQVARDLEDTNALLDAIRSRLLWLGLALSAIAGMVGWLIARRTTRPLRSLTSVVEHVAATRDLTTPIALDRDDEIGRLAASFDEMLAALALSREQQHQLVQDAAHELRTPLTSVTANVELLERAPDLDEDVRREVLDATRSELAQLRTLFTEIIELATDDRDAARVEPVDLAEVAAAAVTTFGARSPRRVELIADPSPVVGDAAALERAVGNLLSNAEKYSPDGSTIIVRVVQGAIGVEDHGPGIPASERERVFDRFYRSATARSLPGSGLGLAIVKKIAVDHGGDVWVRDAPDGGTEVGFTLPSA